MEQMGVMGEKISVIPMGIDETFIEKGKNRRIELNKRSYVILSNRNLLPLYNVSLLIRAIPKVIKEQPCTKFLIAGDGSDREDLEKEADSLNLGSSVQFLGRLPQERMAELFSQADIYVSTSLSDGTSVSLLEAMGSGAFPIVTDIPANREWVVDGKNGFLVPVDQAEILANRILSAIYDRDLLEKSRAENLLIAEKKAFWPTNIRRLEAIYSSVLSNMAQ
jgi:glycosyltransferase involved in cell wall biosynthesis